MVKLLLKDKRVDPSIYNNCAIRWACRNGHSAVVLLLFHDKRANLFSLLVSIHSTPILTTKP